LRVGDHFALGELFDQYADDVRAFAFRRTASWSTADDAVQSTFLSTWRRFQRNPPGPLTAPSARGAVCAER
jgi:RNA polymerase sigma-70 factor (ECF subfamily)